MCHRKAGIKNGHMPKKMQRDLVECITQASLSCRCIVWRNCSSHVTHGTKHFIYIHLGQVAMLLYQP
ncbi:hypothetical protein GH733_002802, partial [Mirounga leonina]